MFFGETYSLCPSPEGIKDALWWTARIGPSCEVVYTNMVVMEMRCQSCEHKAKGKVDCPICFDSPVAHRHCTSIDWVTAVWPNLVSVAFTVSSFCCNVCMQSKHKLHVVLADTKNRWHRPYDKFFIGRQKLIVWSKWNMSGHWHHMPGHWITCML